MNEMKCEWAWVNMSKYFKEIIWMGNIIWIMLYIY